MVKPSFAEVANRDVATHLTLLSQNLNGATKKIMTKLLGQPVSRLRFERGTSKM
jgi:hypothetical protein